MSVILYVFLRLCLRCDCYVVVVRRVRVVSCRLRVRVNHLNRVVVTIYLVSVIMRLRLTRIVIVCFDNIEVIFWNGENFRFLRLIVTRDVVYVEIVAVILHKHFTKIVEGGSYKTPAFNRIVKVLLVLKEIIDNVFI